jgi:hypothetical protein
MKPMVLSGQLEDTSNLTLNYGLRTSTTVPFEQGNFSNLFQNADIRCTITFTESAGADRPVSQRLQ